MQFFCGQLICWKELVDSFPPPPYHFVLAITQSARLSSEGKESKLTSLQQAIFTGFLFSSFQGDLFEGGLNR